MDVLTAFAMIPKEAAAAGLGVLGLFLGSFYNVCADRYLTGESVTWPPSHCASCNARLRPWELIPVLSWCFLRGKCGHCGAKLSAAYPLSELVSGLLAAAIGLKLGITPAALGALILTAFFLILSGIDLRVYLLPDRYTLTGAVVALPVAVFLLGHDLMSALTGGFGAAAFFWLLREYYLRVRKMDALGLGDVKLMLMIGFACGVEVLPLVVIIAGVAALFAFAFVKLTGKTAEPVTAHRIPFGPFLCLGGWTGMLFGFELWQAWFRLITG